uniref:Uncharacterized protein n=1 Tax=Acrobeloides nanus TaxID=290746 RepID=A0A914EFX7_9BILA
MHASLARTHSLTLSFVGVKCYIIDQQIRFKSVNSSTAESRDAPFKNHVVIETKSLFLQEHAIVAFYIDQILCDDM